MICINSCAAKKTTVLSTPSPNAAAIRADTVLGYVTDYAFGQKRGQQTLVLKTHNRSACVRLHWGTVMGDTTEDRQLVDDAIQSAIKELM